MVREDPLNTLIRLPQNQHRGGVQVPQPVENREDRENQFFYQGEVHVALEEAKLANKYVLVLIYRGNSEEDSTFRGRLVNNVTIGHIVPQRCISLNIEYDSFDGRQFRETFFCGSTPSILIVNPEDMTLLLNLQKPEIEVVVKELRDILSVNEDVEGSEDSEIEDDGLYGDMENFANEETVENTETGVQEEEEEEFDIPVVTREEREKEAEEALNTIKKLRKERELEKQRELEERARIRKSLEDGSPQYGESFKKKFDESKINDRKKNKLERKQKKKVILEQIRREKIERERRIKEMNHRIIQSRKEKEKSEEFAKSEDSTFIRVKLPDSTIENLKFPRTMKFGDVRKYLVEKYQEEFKIVKSFPKIVFMEKDDELTLEERGLVPNGTLFLFHKFGKRRTSSTRETSISEYIFMPLVFMFSLIVGLFMTIVGLLNWFISLFYRVEEREVDTEAQEARMRDEERKRATERRHKYRTIFDEKDDEEGRLTWNGDSTVMENKKDKKE